MRYAWLAGLFALVLCFGVAAPASAGDEDVEIVEMEEAPTPEAGAEPEKAQPAPTPPAPAAEPAAEPTPAAPAAEARPAAAATRTCVRCGGCCECQTVTCPAVTCLERVPVYEDVEVPVCETKCTPVYREVEVPVYAVRQVPVYGFRRVPVYEEVEEAVCETRCVPLTRECCDPCTGCIITVPRGYRMETVQTGTRKVQRLTGWACERYECSTRPERYQCGTETQRVFCGNKVEVVQTGTRKERRFVGWRCEPKVVRPERTVTVWRCCRCGCCR